MEQLDLNKSTGLKAEDIQWGEPVVVDEIVQPTLEIPKELIPEQKEEEKTPEVELPKDVTFDDTEVETEEVKTTTDLKALQEEAVRAILRKKIEKYNFDVEDDDLSKLSGTELVDFQEQLDDAIIEAKYNEVKTSDPIIEQLLTLRENGGNVDDLLSIIQEQRTLNTIDTTSDSGKLKVIEKYYKEIAKWSDDKVQRKLDQVSNTGGVEDEFDLVNDTYQEHFQQKQQEAVQKAEQENQKQQQLRVQKELAFEKELNNLKLSEGKKKELLQTAFGQGTIKGTGEKIDILDYKILQMQANPQMNIKLAMFINDPEGYDKMILQNVSNKQVTEKLEKEFKFNQTQVKTPDTSVKEQNVKKKIEFKFK
jgi:hypothetical protein